MNPIFSFADHCLGVKTFSWIQTLWVVINANLALVYIKCVYVYIYTYPQVHMICIEHACLIDGINPTNKSQLTNSLVSKTPNSA